MQLDNVEYTIITIGEPAREQHRANIRKLMPWPEATGIEYCNGNSDDDLARFRERYPYPYFNNIKRGELGIWYSTLSAWSYLLNSDLDALVVFEDDAVLEDDFEEQFKIYMRECPDDMEVFALYPPMDQRDDYYRNYLFDVDGYPRQGYPPRFTADESNYYIGSKVVCRGYQGYANAAQVYTKRGIERLLSVIDYKGIYTTVDCLIFILGHIRALRVYTPRPDARIVVSEDKQLPTTIQKTDKLRA